MDDKLIEEQIKNHNIDKEVFKKIIDICDKYFLNDEEISKKRKGAISKIIEDLAKDSTSKKNV